VVVTYNQLDVADLLDRGREDFRYPWMAHRSRLACLRQRQADLSACVW